MDWPAHIERGLAIIGEDVLFTHGVSTTTVRVDFLSVERAAALGFTGVSASSPVCEGMTGDFPNVAIGDTFARGAAIYEIKAKHADLVGGFTRFQLRLV